jgi:hypothetical protein
MIPLDWDPSSNVVLLVAAPTGGVLDYPALATGDPGATAIIDNAINFTALDATDPTQDSANFTTLSPGVYQLNLTLHRGPAGLAALLQISTASDLSGTPIAGYTIVLNSTLNGFVYTPVKVGDLWLPATISNTASGNPVSQLCVVGVLQQPFDWRAQAVGYTVVTGTGTDVITDYVARLNATNGNDIGRCPGITSTERLTLSDVPPAGSADTWTRIHAGAAANIYFMAERQTGTNTFTTSNTTTRAGVRVCPCPLP